MQENISARAHRAKSIPFGVKLRIWAEPCAVCGTPYDMNVDHIIPVARGGSSDLSNLQPLCRACNHIKGCRLSNEQVASVVMTTGPKHFEQSLYRHAERFTNPYDGPDLSTWLSNNPIRRRAAKRMFDAFISRWIRA